MSDHQPSQIEQVRQQMIQKNSSAIRQLAGGKTGSKSADLLGTSSTPLASLAAKRKADSAQFSTFVMQQKLAEDLNETIENHFRQNPSLRDDVFVGILTDGHFSAEVVSLDTAAAAVEDLPMEEAKALLRENPVGYFKSEDFTVRTPEDDSLQDFKQDLDQFFRRNRAVIHYLRQDQQTS